MRRALLLGLLVTGSLAGAQERRGLEDLLPEHAVARLGDPRGSHSSVRSAAFVADGTIVAVHGTSSLQRWSEDGARTLGEIPLNEPLWDPLFVISPDRTLLAVNGDTGCHILDAVTGRERLVIEHEGEPYSVAAWTPDSSRILTVGASVELWDASSGELRWRLERSAKSAACLAGGREIAVVSTDRVIFVATRDGRIVRENPPGWEHTVLARPDGSLVTLWLENVSVLTSVGATVRSFPRPAGKQALSPDGGTLLTGSARGEIIFTDMGSGRCVRTLDAHDGRVTSLDFSPDGRRLLSGGSDGTVRVWDLASGRELAPHAGHTLPVLHIAISPDGKTLASGGYDSTVHLWDLETHADRARIRDSLHPPVAFLTSRVVLTQAGDLIDADTAQVTSRAGCYFLSLDVSPDKKTAVVREAGGHGLSLFDVASWKKNGALEGHLGKNTSDGDVGRFSRDGKFVICSASTEPAFTVAIFDAKTGALLTTLDGHDGNRGGATAIAAAHDGDTIASVEEGRVLLWSLARRERIATIPLPGAKRLSAVEFSPDDRLLAVADVNDVLLVDMKTREVVRTLRGHSEFVSSLAFTPDGKLLASGSWDSTIILWSLPR